MQTGHQTLKRRMSSGHRRFLLLLMSASLAAASGDLVGGLCLAGRIGCCLWSREDHVLSGLGCGFLRKQPERFGFRRASWILSVLSKIELLPVCSPKQTLASES